METETILFLRNRDAKSWLFTWITRELNVLFLMRRKRRRGVGVSVRMKEMRRMVRMLYIKGLLVLLTINSTHTRDYLLL